MKKANTFIDTVELKRRLSLPLEEKVKWAIEKYLDYLEVYSTEGVYLSFSGGKDSQVLCHIIDELHAGNMCHYLTKEYKFLYDKLVRGKPSPPKVFCDTGLEFPEIRKHVKKFDNVVRLKPKMKWTEVVMDIGFLIGSKKTSRMISDLRHPTENNKASRNLYLTGIKRDGTKTKSFKLAKRWRKLIDADFKVSGKCCDVFKKDPFKEYEKLTGRKPIMATLTEESVQRRVSYLQTGCNSFGVRAKSRPLSIWREEQVWEYSEKNNIRFADVYYEREVEIKENDGTLSKAVVKG